MLEPWDVILASQELDAEQNLCTSWIFMDLHGSSWYYGINDVLLQHWAAKPSKALESRPQTVGILWYLMVSQCEFLLMGVVE